MYLSALSVLGHWQEEKCSLLGPRRADIKSGRVLLDKSEWRAPTLLEPSGKATLTFPRKNTGLWLQIIQLQGKVLLKNKNKKSEN